MNSYEFSPEAETMLANADQDFTAEFGAFLDERDAEHAENNLPEGWNFVTA